MVLREMNLSKELHIYIVAGEPSGDYLGGELINYLKKLYPLAKFSGVGGTKMSSHRFESLFNMSDISVMGIIPVFLRIFSLIKRINLVKNDIIRKNPDIVILIDSPDFNHRIARSVKKLSPNIPIICYVAPSAWAWRQGRAKKMAKYFDHLFALFPFEEDFFKKFGLKTTYVGHPVIERIKKVDSNSTFKSRYNLKGERILILLPGSRSSEIKRHVKYFKDVIYNIKKDHPEFDLVVAINSDKLSLIRENLDELLIIENEEEKLLLFKEADFACATSGTVTLELGLSNTPMVVIYKMDIVSWLIISNLVKVNYVSLINLILGKESSKELLQKNCTSEKITKELNEMIENKKYQKEQIMDLQEFQTLMNFKDNNNFNKVGEVIEKILIEKN